MNVTFIHGGILQIDDARITFRNFAGAPTKFNREGDRNFAVVIPDEETADALSKEGWNVKVRPPREDGDDPFIYLPVKIKFNARGPQVYLVTGAVQNELDEESMKCLDDIDIISVDMDLRAYDWVRFEGTKDEKRGRTAYLQAIRVRQASNRFAPRYEGVPY